MCFVALLFYHSCRDNIDMIKLAQMGNDGPPDREQIRIWMLVDILNIPLIVLSGFETKEFDDVDKAYFWALIKAFNLILNFHHLVWFPLHQFSSVHKETWVMTIYNVYRWYHWMLTRLLWRYDQTKKLSERRSKCDD